jgi:hypothetical protein
VSATHKEKIGNKMRKYQPLSCRQNLLSTDPKVKELTLCLEKLENRRDSHNNEVIAANRLMSFMEYRAFQESYCQS